mmetsp:Transcript_110843/g.313654  ORF Transcript_110843/g.313654 Transcript_110843/m.313654 type:complete len:258 (-) Transcript_110843:64-837(-)
MEFPVSTSDRSMAGKLRIRTRGMPSQSRRRCWRCNRCSASASTSSGTDSRSISTRCTLIAQLIRASLMSCRKARGSGLGFTITLSETMLIILLCRSRTCLTASPSPPASWCSQTYTRSTQASSAASRVASCGSSFCAAASSATESKVQGTSTVRGLFLSSASSSSLSCWKPCSGCRTGVMTPGGAGGQVHGKSVTSVQSSASSLATRDTKSSTTLLFVMPPLGGLDCDLQFIAAGPKFRYLGAASKSDGVSGPGTNL